MSDEIKLKILRNDEIIFETEFEDHDKFIKQSKIKMTSSVTEFSKFTIDTKSPELYSILVDYNRDDIIEVIINNPKVREDVFFRGTFLRSDINYNKEIGHQIFNESISQLFKMQTQRIKKFETADDSNLLDIIRQLFKVCNITCHINKSHVNSDTIGRIKARNINAYKALKLICISNNYIFELKSNDSITFHNRNIFMNNILNSTPVATFTDKDISAMKYSK